MPWLEGREYFWVVLCKNRGFHNKYNFSSSYAIPLGETNEISGRPQVGSFTVRCDDCREEHTYYTKDVLRAEIERPVSFLTHPLFLNTGVSADDSIPSRFNLGKNVLGRIRAAVARCLHLPQKERVPHWRKQGTP